MPLTVSCVHFLCWLGDQLCACSPSIHISELLIKKYWKYDVLAFYLSLYLRWEYTYHIYSAEQTLPEHWQTPWWINGVQGNIIEIFSHFGAFLTKFRQLREDYALRKYWGVFTYSIRSIYSALYGMKLLQEPQFRTVMPTVSVLFCWMISAFSSSDVPAEWSIFTV